MKGEFGPACYLVSVIAAVTVRVSLLLPSAHSFVHSEGLCARGWTRPSQLSQDTVQAGTLWPHLPGLSTSVPPLLASTYPCET